MTGDDRDFQREFHRAIKEEPLEPSDKRYVPLYGSGALIRQDPVTRLAREIELAPSNTSVQLLSGFRGSGKSTELRRLRHVMADRQYAVLLFDVQDYIDPSMPLDISDFLLVVAGAISDKVVLEGFLETPPAQRDFWTRITEFMSTRAELEELSARVGGVGIKAALSRDPSFRQQLQDRSEGHLTALVNVAHEFIREVSTTVRSRGDFEGVVVIVDSVEQIRGTLNNEEDVQQSVERLFSVHARNLRLPDVHTLYTVPPWLKFRVQNVGSDYGGGVQTLYPVRITERETGQRDDDAYDALEQVVQLRGDWPRLLGSRDHLDRLIEASGGHLRDLFRLLREVLIGAVSYPADDLAINDAIATVRRDYVQIPNDIARWMLEIDRTGDPQVPDEGAIPRFAKLLETHLVFCYRNGDEWYALHPLIREAVKRQVTELDEQPESLPVTQTVTE